MSRERFAALLGLAVLFLMLGIACGDSGPSYHLQSAAYPTDVEECAALNKFDRYRYKFTYWIASPQPAGPVDVEQIGIPPFGVAPDSPDVELSQEYEGAIVNPDKIDLVIRTPQFPDQNWRFLEGIQWMKLGEGWTLVERPEPYNYSPALVCHAILAGLELAGTPTPETVNGLETSHYQFEDARLFTGAYLFNAESDMGRLLERYSVDVWLTEDGWPARLESRSQGTYPSGRELSMELSLEITDVNSKDIAVEPPS